MGSCQGDKKKQGTTKKLAARTKPKGREIEAVGLEEELGELYLSGGGGYETVDEEVGDTSWLKEGGDDDSFVDIDNTLGIRSND